MSEPLFQVGQHVAVCTHHLEVVIPITQVVESVFERECHISNPFTGEVLIARNKWTYRVSGSEFWYTENHLRPINPDTEYQDQPQTTEVPA